MARHLNRAKQRVWITNSEPATRATVFPHSPLCPTELPGHSQAPPAGRIAARSFASAPRSP